MKNILLVFLSLVLISIQVIAQDEVLLTIEGQPVMRSEFERIYHKNNNIEGYENKSPQEYLDMFINFKLKVLEARNLGFDTLSSFKSELDGYREQLSRPYLQDRNVIDKLVQEAYYRTVNEVNASHIMVKLPANPTPEDTFKAYNRALGLRNRILAGESFEKIAQQESDDPSSKVNKGNLRWFSAFTMVYPFEEAAYKTKIGDCSMPVRSKYGYHIIKTLGMRPAMGEIRLAHIMVRGGSDEAQHASAREKINACYNALNNGSKFADMVKQYSEDAGTARSNGVMRWLRSGELPPEIENIVFSLKDSGDITSPVQSAYGWHIFQLQGKRPIPPFEQIKSQLEEKVLMDERGKMTEENFLNKLKKDYNYSSYPENASDLAEVLDSSLYAGNWDPAMASNMIEPVFTIAGREYTQKDLAGFIGRTKRFSKKETYQSIISRKLNEMSRNELLNFEKSQLEAKYPSFKYLMEEYHDGILLFNIMDNKVWSKAVNDTNALRDFYTKNEANYVWKERADVSIYTLSDRADLKKITALAKKRIKTRIPAEAFIKTACATDTVPCVKVTDEKYEAGEKLPAGGFEWKKGAVKTSKEGNSVKLLVVNAILPPSPKQFHETQGQVTADYQNYLDRQWIDELRSKYKVVVNQEILKKVK